MNEIVKKMLEANIEQAKTMAQAALQTIVTANHERDDIEAAVQREANAAVAPIDAQIAELTERRYRQYEEAIATAESRYAARKASLEAKIANAQATPEYMALDELDAMLANLDYDDEEYEEEAEESEVPNE